MRPLNTTSENYEYYSNSKKGFTKLNNIFNNLNKNSNNSQQFTITRNYGLKKVLKNLTENIENFAQNDPNGCLRYKEKLYLYYTIFDVEVSKSKTILGFYFPLINHYHVFEFEEGMSVGEFHIRRMEVLDFVKVLINSSKLYELNPYLLEKTGLSLQELEEISQKQGKSYTEKKYNVVNNEFNVLTTFLNKPLNSNEILHLR